MLLCWNCVWPIYYIRKIETFAFILISPPSWRKQMSNTCILLCQTGLFGTARLVRYLNSNVSKHYCENKYHCAASDYQYYSYLLWQWKFTCQYALLTLSYIPKHGTNITFWISAYYTSSVVTFCGNQYIELATC